MSIPPPARVALPFLALWLLPALTAAQGEVGPADEAVPAAALGPNIVLIFADDQRVDTIGAWGGQGIATPNLDRLVSEGTSFRRAYCMGSAHGAVCAPSRAMLHTGRPYHAIDHSTMEGCRTLGERLGDAGYRTFGTGKWHNGRESFTRSFGTGGTVFFGGMADHFAVKAVDMAERGEFSEPRVLEEHSSDAFAGAAVRFLGEAPVDAPVFCYVALTAPHDPRDAPLEWREGRERPALPANFLPQHPFDNGFLKVRDEKLAGWPRDPEVVREQLAEYYALIEHMDAAVGRIVRAAEGRDDGRETLIVFAADHGLALGSHGLLGKQSVYEHSLRAPMIVKGPGVPAGRHVTALTYLLDLYPTLLGMAGAPLDEGAFGADLRPLWYGDVAEVRPSLYLSMGRGQRAVTDGRYKLCVYPLVGHRQLFDLASDPHEMINLAEIPAFDAHLERLSASLGEWRMRVQDPDPLVVDEPKPLYVDLTGAERKSDRWQPEWIREKYFDPEPEMDPEAEAAPEGGTEGGDKADSPKKGA